MTDIPTYGADKRFMSPTITCLPGSSAVLASSKLPLGLIVTPQARVPTAEPPVPSINGITAVPKSYFSPLNENGIRQDLKSRPELTNPSIEYIASDDYTVRPPQAACYFFVIDVTTAAITSGFFQQTITTIKKHLDELQGDSRTRIGFMCVAKEVHCFNLDPQLASPEMIVISQTDSSPTLPHLSSTLLANFEDSREHVDYLLNNFVAMYNPGKTQAKSCFSSAIHLATTILASVGGLCMCFLSTIPDTGYRKLEARFDQSLVGTANEHRLLKSSNPWLSQLGHRANYSHNITISMFVGALAYVDIAALNQLVKWTGGRLFYYPSFHPERNAAVFDKQYLQYIQSIVGFESVLRVRCSAGFSVSYFHGNFAVRNNDLMSLPVSHTDTTALLEFNVVDTAMPGSRFTKNRRGKSGPKRHFSTDPTQVRWGYFQAAHLYTAPTGERKIRIHTLCMRITHKELDLFSNVNLEATFATMVRKALLKTVVPDGIKHARELLSKFPLEVSGSYTSKYGGQIGVTATNLPDNLALLPILSRAFLKNYSFQHNTNTIVDYRAWLLALLITLPCEASVLFFKPNLWPIFNLHEGDYCIPRPGENPLSTLPPSLPLSRSSIHTAGIYLFDNGIDMFVWLGRSLHPTFILQIFGIEVSNVNELNLTTLKIPEKPLDNTLSQRFHTLIETCQQLYPLFARNIYIVREGDSIEISRIPSLLVAD